MRIVLVALLAIVSAHWCMAEDPAAPTSPASTSTQENALILWAAPVTTGWTWANLSYGPLEIASGAFIPVAGAFVGGVGGVVAPMNVMDPYCVALIPYTLPAGVGVGSVIGAVLAPIVIIEGVFDTLTGGFFADQPFSWFNISPELLEKAKEAQSKETPSAAAQKSEEKKTG